MSNPENSYDLSEPNNCDSTQDDQSEEDPVASTITMIQLQTNPSRTILWQLSKKAPANHRKMPPNKTKLKKSASSWEESTISSLTAHPIRNPRSTQDTADLALLLHT